MSNKTDYTNRLRLAVTDFARATETCEALTRMFESRRYGLGDVDELTQADLDAEGIELDVTDIRGFAATFGDVGAWLDTGGRRQALDRLRIALSL